MSSGELDRTASAPAPVPIEKHPRLVGLLFCAFTSVCGYFFIWTPLEQAARHEPEVHVPSLQATGLFASMFALGFMLLVGGPRVAAAVKDSSGPENKTARVAIIIGVVVLGLALFAAVELRLAQLGYK